MKRFWKWTNLTENNTTERILTLTTASNALKIPVVATRGKAMWAEENSAVAESDTSFGQKTIVAHKLCALIKVSEEL